jgi:hypothetical protein
MLRKLRTPASIFIGAMLSVGCANDGTFLGNNLITSSVSEPQVDPVCVTLTTQIDTLRKDGISEKIEKAAAKKYKMTSADLTKADQLNKANTEFQAKCSTMPRQTVAAAAAPAAKPAGHNETP